MPQVIFLPHAELCPDGAVLEAPSGTTVLDLALKNGIDIEHACVLCMYNVSYSCPRRF